MKIQYSSPVIVLRSLVCVWGVSVCLGCVARLECGCVAVKIQHSSPFIVLRSLDCVWVWVCVCVWIRGCACVGVAGFGYAGRYVCESACVLRVRSIDAEGCLWAPALVLGLRRAVDPHPQTQTETHAHAHSYTCLHTHTHTHTHNGPCRGSCRECPAARSALAACCAPQRGCAKGEMGVGG